MQGRALAEVVLTLDETESIRLADLNGLLTFPCGEHFMVYALDGSRRIASEQSVDSPEGCGCKSDIAGILSRMGVSHMVAGNMGEGAVRIMHAHGIEVIRGASGGTREAVGRFSAGTLEDSGTACVGHAHGHHDGKDCDHH